MGLFSSTKPAIPKHTDKVWKTAQYALKGMITDALQSLVKNEIPVVVTYFRQSHEQLISFLEANNVPHFIVNASELSTAASQTKVIFVLQLHFAQPLLPDFLDKLAGAKHILFLGHYPLPAKENSVLEKINNVKEMTLTFYSSLDETIMATFGATNIIDLMNKMGMKDEEAIEHSMVSKAMQRAREKLEEKVKFDHEAFSETEWFEKNLPKSN